jgi:hypothetical protein
MRASPRASRADATSARVRARRPARRSCFVTVFSTAALGLCVACALGASGSASADVTDASPPASLASVRPPPGPLLAPSSGELPASASQVADFSGERPRATLFEAALFLENDNLLFGHYGRMVGHELDGSDIGRTHASGFWAWGRLGDAHALRLEAWSELYTRSVNGEKVSRFATIPIHFHELSGLRLGLDWAPPGAALRARLGVGLDVSNEADVTFGASGQQQFYHSFSARELASETWQYTYHPTQRQARLGAAVDASVGGRTTLALAPWLWLEAEGHGGLRLGTIFEGSRARAEGRVGAAIGDPRGVHLALARTQRVDVWLAHQGAMVRSTVDARLDLELLALQVAVHRYDGDQNEAYYRYALENITMTVAVAVRAY